MIVDRDGDTIVVGHKRDGEICVIITEGASSTSVVLTRKQGHELIEQVYEELKTARESEI